MYTVHTVKIGYMQTEKKEKKLKKKTGSQQTGQKKKCDSKEWKKKLSKNIFKKAIKHK